ncbi:uncharacterized protein LOC111243084 isoform X2 [Varroa destructor]|uniref:Spaetzle domain-containing protein n=1 Tax=Varroa destructor TaxID=109461 RepID=A0A7M7IX85_VARDE|nr:uncharacterized protein LOC111243084 isoform X2 [Varroa destructor]
MNLFENLRKFLTAILSVVSRTPTNVDQFQKPSIDIDGCDPFCADEKHPLPDEVQIDVLMKNMPFLKTFYQKRKPELATYTPGVTAVLRDEDHYIPLCDSLKRDYMPKAAKDVYGVKHFLLNPDSGDYQQLVETEHCRDTGAACPALVPYSLPNQRSICRTHFFKRGLTAINTSSLEPYEIVVKIPSGCNCFVRHSISSDLYKGNP